VRGGSNPGQKRSGAVDGALPVEAHLRSWGRERAQSGAEVVRPGSYPVSRIVPKKSSAMPLPEGLVRIPPKPKTRARWDLVQIVQLVRFSTKVRTVHLPIASPAQDKPVRGGLNQGPRRSGPVHGALSPALVYLVGLFEFDPLLSLCPPQMHPPRSTQSPGVLESRGGSA
jgi:hypothetical protein